MRRLSVLAVLLLVAVVVGSRDARAGGSRCEQIDERSPKYRGDQSAVLRDPRGRVIARTHKQFKLDLVRQGTGWLRDGRTINYNRKVNGESRFRITTSKYGLGSTGCRLVPYRTICGMRCNVWGSISGYCNPPAEDTTGCIQLYGPDCASLENAHCCQERDIF